MTTTVDVTQGTTLTGTFPKGSGQGTATITSGRLVGDFPGGAGPAGPQGPVGPPGPQGPVGPAGSTNGGGTTPQSWNINVRDYGAKGDASTDDAAAFQAALDEAFGPASAPHGNGGRNRAMYIPAGMYRLLTPLVMTDVWGGHIYGDGKLATSIFYDGPVVPVNAEGWCPTLWANGCGYCTFENFTLSGPRDPNGKTVCLWFGPDGTAGGSSAHSNTLISVGFGNTSYGVIHGSGGSQANSGNTYLGCVFSQHAEVGLFLSGPNTLNMRMYGGSVSACGVAGIKTHNSATIPVISNPELDGNYVDINLYVSSPCSIDGCRSESGCFVKTSGGPVTIRSCSQSTSGGTLTGSTKGTTLTVTATTSPSISIGMVIYGSQGSNALPLDPPTRIVKQLTSVGQEHGIGTYQLSAAGSPGDLSSTALTFRPVYLEQEVGHQSVVDVTGPESSSDPCIIGGDNSQLRLRNNGFFYQAKGTTPPDLFKFFKGKIFEYDVACLNKFTVANLPAASAIFKGCRMWVTDSLVAASGNYAAIVSGGGDNTVTVWCDGEEWRIG